jgi:protein involved in sex pheromone biosynthesis
MKKRTLAVFIAVGLLLCGCSGKNNNDNNTKNDIDNNVDNNVNYVVGDYDFGYN